MDKLFGSSIQSGTTWEQTILNSDVIMMLRRRCLFSWPYKLSWTKKKLRCCTQFPRRRWSCAMWQIKAFPKWHDLNLTQTLLQLRLTMTSQIALVEICFVSGRQSGWIYRIQLWGSISPVLGGCLSSGKKHCVSKDEDYKKHESPKWANLTFKSELAN